MHKKLQIFQASYNILKHLKTKFNAGSKTPVTLGEAEGTARLFQIFNTRIGDLISIDSRYSIELCSFTTNMSKNCTETVSDFQEMAGNDSDDLYLEEKARQYIITQLEGAEKEMLYVIGQESIQMQLEGKFDALPEEIKALSELGIAEYQAQQTSKELEREAEAYVIGKSATGELDINAVNEYIKDNAADVVDLNAEDVEVKSRFAKPSSKISSDIHAKD